MEKWESDGCLSASALCFFCFYRPDVKLREEEVPHAATDSVMKAAAGYPGKLPLSPTLRLPELIMEEDTFLFMDLKLIMEIDRDRVYRECLFWAYVWLTVVLIDFFQFLKSHSTYIYFDRWDDQSKCNYNK